MSDRTILVVTSLDDITADMVIGELSDRGATVARIDPADIGDGLWYSASIGGGQHEWGGMLETPTRTVDLGRVQAVYYRRPSPWDFGQLAPQYRGFAAAEARHGLGGVLASLPGCIYVNHPAATARADFKADQLRVAARLGFSVPATLITNDVHAARSFAARHAPVIYKTFRGVPPGRDGRAGAIWAQRIDPASLDDDLTVTAQLFQAEIDKARAGDVRVTVVGRRVFARRISSPGNPLDWRSGDWDALTYTPVQVPERVTRATYAYLDHFGLFFGCFDFAVDQHTGTWHWIECNPNGQWGFLPDCDAIAAAFADVLQAG